MGWHFKIVKDLHDSYVKLRPSVLQKPHHSAKQVEIYYFLFFEVKKSFKTKMS